MSTDRRRYTTPVMDSARWERVRLCAGDIVVATPYKAGTTWTQLLCALVVHGAPPFPQPLPLLSTWVDRTIVPVDEMAARFDAQPSPRILKTHTPLDGLPDLSSARIVVCGRDPRDAFLSMLDHVDNLSPQARAAAGGSAAERVDPGRLFRYWMTTGSHPWEADGAPFGPYFHQVRSFWEIRARPGVLFVHYADLCRDLDGEFARLAAFLGASPSAAERARLLESASFEAMRRDADTLAPGADGGSLLSNAEFFRHGRLGAWREAVSEENQRLYRLLTRKRYDAAMLDWLENGRAAAGDPARL